MNILITGGCGFIGSNFINQIVTKYPKYNIVNIDALYYCASAKNIEVENNSNYKFIQGNLNSYDFILYILQSNNIDTVINFAAQSHVDNSFSNSLQYTRDNILGTHTLLEACRIYGKIKKFIHVSTDEVYGESMLSNDEKKKNEESILCPTNPYAATKAGAELIAMSYYHSYKMPILVTRGNNVYGERQYPEKLIPKFICLLLENKNVTIHGSGVNKRAFIHVSDVVNAFDVILHKGQIGEIYNIGSNDHYEFPVTEVAKILINKLKPNEPIESYITHIRDRHINDKRYYISNDKVKKLGWNQEVSFDVGIDRVIEWYKKIDYKSHWGIQNITDV